LGGGEEGEREEREKGIRGVVLGWGSHVNSFAKLAQVTDAQNKACVKRSRVLFRGTPKIVYIVIAVSGGNNGYITTILVYITSFVCTRMQNWTRSLCQANKYIVVF
jgi:hypothetical protein